MKKYDYTVIGGGISGILMSSLLTVRGFSVCLLESSSRLGGYFQNITLDRVPYGAHHIAIPNREIIEELFQTLNINLSSKLISADKVTIFYNKERYLISLKLLDLEKNLINYFPEEGNQISNFIAYLKEFSLALNNGQSEMIKQFFMETVFISFESLLQTYFENEQLKGVLSAIGPSYAGVYPKDSAFTYLSLLATYGSGAYYFEEYGEMLIKELKVLIDNGENAIKYNFKASKLVENDGSYFVLNERGEKVYTEKIIISCYPLDLLQTLPQETILQKKIITKLSELKVGASAWRFYFKVNKKLRNHEYIYHFSNYKSPIPVEENKNFVISTMDKSKDKINIMATIIEDSISEEKIANEILPRMKTEIGLLLDIDEEGLEYCATIGRKNREVLTLNKNGSVFGWSRDVKGNLDTNMVKNIYRGWKNIHVIGHWSTTFGIYGSILTVLDAMPKVIK